MSSPENIAANFLSIDQNRVLTVIDGIRESRDSERFALAPHTGPTLISQKNFSRGGFAPIEGLLPWPAVGQAALSRDHLNEFLQRDAYAAGRTQAALRLRAQLGALTTAHALVRGDTSGFKAGLELGNHLAAYASSKNASAVIRSAIGINVKVTTLNENESVFKLADSLLYRWPSLRKRLHNAPESMHEYSRILHLLESESSDFARHQTYNVGDMPRSMFASRLLHPFVKKIVKESTQPTMLETEASMIDLHIKANLTSDISEDDLEKGVTIVGFIRHFIQRASAMDSSLIRDPRFRHLEYHLANISDVKKSQLIDDYSGQTMKYAERLDPNWMLSKLDKMGILSS